MGDSLKAGGQQQDLEGTFSNQNDNRIPFQSRIGIKLILGFLVIASLTALAGYLSLNYAQSVSEKFHSLTAQTLPTIDALDEMKLSALDIEGATNEYVFTPGSYNKSLQEITDGKKEFVDNLNRYTNLVNTYFPEEQVLRDSIMRAWNTFIQNSSKLVQLRQGLDPAATLSPELIQEAVNLKENFEPDELLELINDAIADEVQEVEERTNAVDQAIDNSSYVILSSIIISVIAALSFGVYFSRYISIPISNLKEAAYEIGKGNFGTASKVLSRVKRRDELGILSIGIENMRKNIESMKTNLDKLVAKLEVKNHELMEKDIDLRKLNQELIKTEQAKEEFMSMVSHELKTPLSPMKLYTQMLLSSTKSFGDLNGKQSKAVNVILNNIMKLEVLISDILDVYKLDIGRLRINKADVDIEKLVNQVITEFKPVADEHKIALQKDIRTLGSVKCDPQRINQVISNLVKNSLDFVPKEGGRITVRAEEDSTDPQKVLFTVEDNGTGIPDDKIDNLFKKFYQIDTKLTRKHGGTGLGLAISRGLVEAHGGEMWVDKGYTKGASFKFILSRNGETE